MRFEWLELAPYGRFADRRIAFAPEAALHVVLGRNEAGKTTLLSAIGDFLFGVPERTSYAFEHGYEALRIGAALCFADGGRFEARRRKGRGATLVDGSSKAVSEDRLRVALAGLERDGFDAEYGLTQLQLREGSKALLKAGGKLAETLAAGSAGLGALVKIRERLDEEAGALFTPRQSGGKAFYKAFDDYKTADRKLRDAVVTADALKGAERKRAEALNLEQRLREDAEEVSRKLGLRERAGRTHQTLAHLTGIVEALQAFGDLAEIDADALADARQALDDDRALSATLTQLELERASEAEEIARRFVDAAWLAEGGAIEALREKLSEVRKAAEDLPRRVEARRQEIENLDALARRLGLSGHAALLADPPRDAELGEARQALKRRGEAARLRDDARERLREATRRREETRRALPADAADPGPLRRRLDALAERVADAERWRRESAALKRRAAELDALAATLNPAVPDLGALARTPLPAAEEIAASAEAFQALAQARDLAAREIEATERGCAEAETQLRALTHAAAGATRGDWLAARESREAGLDALGLALAAAGENRLALYTRSRALVLACDAVGDRFVGNVERATRLEAAREDCAARREAHDRAKGRAQRLAAQSEDAEAAWRALWARSGLSPSAPAAMARWRERVGTLLAGRSDLEATRADLVRLNERVAEAEASLADALARIGVDASPGFEIAYRQARAELAERETAFEAARKAAQSQAQAEHAVQEAGQELEHRQGEFDAVARDWPAAMRALRLEADGSPEAAEAALAAWGAVPAPRKLMERETRSIEGIERDLAEFADQTRLLVARIAPELAAARPEEAVGRLVERLGEARRVAAERRQLEKSAEARAARRRAEEDKRQALSPRLAAARRRLGAADDDALALALERCQARREFRSRRAEGLDRLAAAGDGLSEAELRVEQAAFEPALAADEIAGLKRRREEIAAAQREAARDARDADAELEAVTRGRDAAGAARERAEAADEMAEVAEHWLLRIAASRLAGRAIERHRAVAQDPLVARAGQLFAVATAGSFVGLGVRFEEGPLLVARRPNGNDVEVNGLSEGARDQLFLSLRLALLERRAGEPLPFIGDDLLASFDDERTRHTLDLLAEFGARRQTILFTHHARVAELARGLNGRSVDVVEI